MSLEPKLMDVLVALALRAPEVLSTDELLTTCWAGHFYGDNPVHKAIAQLRRALGDDARAPRYIATIRKRGYQVTASVAFPDGRSAVKLPLLAASAPPYPGGPAFDFLEAPLFFGRRRCASEGLKRLKGAHSQGYAFLLVYGPPVSGKTSLVCAGVAPPLLSPAGYDGLRALAFAMLRGDRADGRPWDALATALCAWHIDGEPIFVESEHASLTRSLLEDLNLVLGRIAHRLHGHGAVLMLFVDDLDVLLRESTDATMARAFLEAMSTMAATGQIAIVATCQDPSLDGHVANSTAIPPVICQVMAPTPGELALMIRLPARMACLRFEQDAGTEQLLDDVLLEHVRIMQHPLRVLPSLLRRLYDARSDDGVLTFEAYRQACTDHARQDRTLVEQRARHRTLRRTFAVRLHRQWRERLLRTLAILAVSACCLGAVSVAWVTAW
ncbi:winged helix-turn-helix domain-containing protein [Luteibacter sp. OK325]|uniref:nSTAND1 domain-containing NTPase n=1 Tax=Luteibacter sp. OK325 TaxID=2135670 RepID=UPI001304F599|nr:winged helix-turn-helix domain-containing protein [Luteibacter sp. OK325]